MTVEFTKDIDTTTLDKKTIDKFSKMENHDEVLAKENKQVCCHDCRWFSVGVFGACSGYIGMYHKTCKDFKWW